MTDSPTDIRIDQVVDVDPNRVRVADNIRHDLGDLIDLTKSIKANGVLIPVLVVPVEGDADYDYDLRYGQRRHAAAVAANRPLRAIVGHDVDDRAARIIEQLVENGHRKDLTVAEEVEAYRQLELCGLSVTTIAKRAATNKKRVQAALAVAANDVVAAAVAQHNLDLEEAMVIAELGDDEAAVAKLTAAAATSPGHFAHVASRLRQERADAEQRADTVAALQGAGVTVLDPEDDDSGTQLYRLCEGEDTEAITPEAHAGCPGHAAVVAAYDPSNVSYVCIDPEAYGHKFRPGYGTPKATGGPKSDKEKADMRLVRENNKKWRAAESVRREYVQTLLQRRTVPKATLRFAVTEVLIDPDRVGDGRDELLAVLLGVEKPGGWGRTVGAAHMAKVGEAQLPLALLAQVAADREQTMDVMTWRHCPAAAARWLSFLASTGYTLSEVEQLVVDKGLADETGDDDATEVAAA
jgi:ParB family chromosome partitioning protein